MRDVVRVLVLLGIGGRGEERGCGGMGGGGGIAASVCREGEEYLGPEPVVPPFRNVTECVATVDWPA